jgi:hypothetical protein
MLMQRFCPFCRLSVSLCFAALIIFPAIARADTFSFQLTSSQYNGSGYLTAVPDASTAGAYDVTDISGDINGTSISGLLPCDTYSQSSPCGGNAYTFQYDNVLYPAGIPPFNIVDFDDRGLAFQLGSELIDLAYGGTHFTVLTFNGENEHEPPIYVGFNVTPVPEPGSFALLGSGLLTVAAGMCRRLSHP